MPAQQTTSSFAAKMGNRLDAAIKAHATDETEYGFQRLPPGINNGIAQLTKCYFQEHPAGHKNAGKWFCRFEGTLVFPEYHNVGGMDMKVAGMQTSQIFPVYDTTTTSQPPKMTPAAEHIANILNEFRKFGVDTTNVTTAAQMEAVAAMLTKQRPHFRIRTSVRAARNPQETPGVWENWDGIRGVEGYGEQVGDSYALAGATDGTAASAQPAPSSNGHATTAPAAPAQASAPKPAPAARPAPAGKPAPAAAKPAPAPAQPAPAPQPAQQELDIDQQDINTLVQLADSKNSAAQRRLVVLALEAGHDQETVDGAQSWADVVELINNPVASAEEQAAAEDEGAGGGEEEFLPAVDEIYGFHPLDKATGAPAAKKVEVKITAVDPNARTVDLQNMENKRLKYNKVSFDSLVSAD